MAAPTAMALNPSSAIGVSMTRSAPNSSNMPLEALYAPLYSATSSPSKNTDSSRRISSLMASATASLNVTSRILCCNLGGKDSGCGDAMPLGPEGGPDSSHLT